MKIRVPLEPSGSPARASKAIVLPSGDHDGAPSLQLRESPEAIVHGDERLLRRAIANLVENAIRYGAVGGEIVVALERDDAHLRVTVADRGPGVPPAQRAAIFDRFHRASAAAGGSGLGLPIARLTVEAHDGEVALLASDDEHPGATFVITLPLSRALA